MHLTMNIPIKAVGKERPRFSRSGTVYTPKKTKDFEALIGAYVKICMRDHSLSITDGPVCVNVIFWWKYLYNLLCLAWSRASLWSTVGLYRSRPHNKTEVQDVLPIAKEAVNRKQTDDPSHRHTTAITTPTLYALMFPAVSRTLTATLLESDCICYSKQGHGLQTTIVMANVWQIRLCRPDLHSILKLNVRWNSTRTSRIRP